MYKKYSILITGTGRYVRHCDECWYSTSTEEICQYTRQQALAVARQMRSHYVYDVIISNGEDTIHCTLKNRDGAVAPKKDEKAAARKGRTTMSNLAALLGKRK